MNIPFRQIFTPWFIICCTLVILHQIIERILHIHISLLDQYLDPLLLMPIVLQLLLWEKRLLFYKNNRIILSPFQIFIYWLLICIITEIIFPLWQPYFVADFWDCICYLMGAIVFHLWFNKPIM